MIKHDSVCELEGDLIMKKIIALVLALALVTLTGAALAAGSNGGNKYNTTTTTTTNVEPKKEFVFGFSEDEDLVAWANEEVAKLAEGSVADFFGAAADAVANILGEGEYAVNEMLPVYAENYDKSMGPQDITLTFATPYEKDTDVAVMLGFKAGDAVEWNAFAGKVLDGSAVLVKLDPATILRVQDNNALLAVVSK